MKLVREDLTHCKQVLAKEVEELTCWTIWVPNPWTAFSDAVIELVNPQNGNICLTAPALLRVFHHYITLRNDEEQQADELVYDV